MSVELNASDPISTALSFANTIVSRIWPDKTEQERNEIAAVLAIQKAQTDANTAEAGQPGLHFRDGAGWVCVANFALGAFKPVIEWGCALARYPVSLPPVDQTMTYTMLIGLLGLGGMHMNEQIKGTK